MKLKSNFNPTRSSLERTCVPFIVFPLTIYQIAIIAIVSIITDAQQQCPIPMLQGLPRPLFRHG
jgi:hypothetical protein